MAMAFHITMQNHLTTLANELVAAGLSPHVRGNDDEVWIELPTGSSEATMQGVLDAHDATAARTAAKWAEVRRTRNQKLLACDWTDLPNSPVDNPNGWEDYRTALRDVPQSFGTVGEIVWPTKPA